MYVQGWPTNCRQCGDHFQEQWLHRVGMEPMYHQREMWWPVQEHCFQVCDACMERTSRVAQRLLESVDLSAFERW